ncbi:hypothetical protein KP509_25G074400 [Ceratopteris richardii]|uniref:Uncharacterized protein n=1 Tax=Ceratopteris richardii TaxID=49495 RepID=A0A8T2RTQ8_CERRI|nr:hypothetical protein KP509_25G074400 [Ceratopteris richardii]
MAPLKLVQLVVSLNVFLVYIQESGALSHDSFVRNDFLAKTVNLDDFRPVKAFSSDKSLGRPGLREEREIGVPYHIDYAPPQNHHKGSPDHNMEEAAYHTEYHHKGPQN